MLYSYSLLNSVFTLGSLWSAPFSPSTCVMDFKKIDLHGTITTVRSLAPSTKVTAFLNVNVIPMDAERVLVDQTVVIKGGRITALGPSDKVKVPAEAVRVDGSGKYLMPGLADMHVHSVGTSDNDSPPPENLLLGKLMQGVTAIRTLAEGGRGPSIAEMQWLRRFEVSPRMYHAQAFPLKTRPDSVAVLVSRAKAEGYPHLAVPYWWPKTPEERAVLDSLVDAAGRVDLPVSVHAHRLPFEAVLRVGTTTGGSVEHLSSVFWDSLGYWDESRMKALPDEIPTATIQSMVMAVRRAGLWITPTLQCLEGKLWATPAYDRVMRHIVKVLQEAGVGLFLSGDDLWDVHTELAALVRAGLTPYQALATGTRNVAQYFGELDSAGTVAEGKRADLLLLYDNPLQDVRRAREPAGVMVDGRWFDRAELDRRVLAAPKTSSWSSWLESAMWATTLGRVFYASYLPDERRDQFTGYVKTFRVLADSLKTAKPSEHDHLRSRLAEALGAMRVSLTPELHEIFDPIARIWLRTQERHGFPVTIPGVTPMPATLSAPGSPD